MSDFEDGRILESGNVPDEKDKDTDDCNTSAFKMEHVMTVDGIADGSVRPRTRGVTMPHHAESKNVVVDSGNPAGDQPNNNNLYEKLQEILQAVTNMAANNANQPQPGLLTQKPLQNQPQPRQLQPQLQNRPQPGLLPKIGDDISEMKEMIQNLSKQVQNLQNQQEKTPMRSSPSISFFTKTNNGLCFICGEKGHYKLHCPYNHPRPNSGNYSQSGN